ncbi:MAG: hypothetical protein ABI574_03630, partial [Burkholderiales bacterium]
MCEQNAQRLQGGVQDLLEPRQRRVHIVVVAKGLFQRRTGRRDRQRAQRGPAAFEIVDLVAQAFDIAPRPHVAQRGAGTHFTVDKGGQETPQQGFVAAQARAQVGQIDLVDLVDLVDGMGRSYG